MFGQYETCIRGYGFILHDGSKSTNLLKKGDDFTKMDQTYPSYSPKSPRTRLTAVTSLINRKMPIEIEVYSL